MFKFTLILQNGTAVNETTKFTKNGKRFFIENTTQLATFIYKQWKKHTNSKSFTDWCKDLNDDENFEGHFYIEDAIDNLASAYTLALGNKKTSVDLFDFMYKELPCLQKMCALESANKDFFEVLFGNQNGIYNLLSVLEYATKTGFTTNVTNVAHEDIGDEVERAERHIQNLCAANVRFGCTENGDWVFAHTENECWC